MRLQLAAATMSYCPHCGESAIAGQKFCMKCGTTLTPGPITRQQRLPAKSNAPIVVGVVASVFVLLLVVVVAIPNLVRARLTPGEGTGPTSVRTIVVAEMTYQSMYGEFATDIRNLGGSSQNCSRPTSANACLIDAAMADSSPSRPKGGYYYVIRPGPTPQSFVISGVPVSRYSKGYCALEDGVIRFDNNAFGSGPASYETCRLQPPLS